MPNPYFQFRQFTIYHDRSAMKVTTDGCLFGAWTAEEMKNLKCKKTEHVLDIGAGTGLLSLMIAQKNEVGIDAVEIEPDAATQAKENSAASPWSNRIHVFEEDILRFDRSKKYDCIVSNPPFYENELQSSLPKKNIAHHSHQLNLKQVLTLIKEQLADEGRFFLLLPYKRNSEVEVMMQEEGLFLTKKISVRQSVLHKPFRIMLMGQKEKKETALSEIAIRDQDRQYTSEFIALLREYYLHL